MKSTLKTLTVAALLSTVTLSLQAQALQAGYFSDSYLYRHRMNPALANRDAYISIPILGGFNTNLSTNFGVKDFIYERKGGGLTTFMNKEVSSEDFKENLSDHSNLRFNFDLPILSVGFKTGKGYNTFEVGAHARAGMSISKDLFYFMKDMATDRKYDLGDIGGEGMAWADVAYGYSREITPDLRIGAKVKALFGLAYANADFSGSSVDFQSDAWQMTFNGSLAIAGGGTMTTKSGTNEMYGYEDFTPGINGFGMAFDLGAVYDFERLVPGLQVSAAITDLGWLKWDCAKAVAENRQFKFDGFNNVKMHPNQGTVTNGKSGYTDGTIDEQFDRIGDDLEKMAKLDVTEQSVKENGAIGATATVGVEYTLPVYKKISFGVLYTQRFSENFGYTEGRAVCNFAPNKHFDLALSGCASTYGTSWGAIANMHFPGFNLFAGFDRIYTGSVNSDCIPLESGAVNASFGISFPLSCK